MADSDLEKTEPASSRRISQAREEGQVPQSRELGTFLSLFVAALVLWTISGWFYQRLSAVLRDGLTFGRAQAFQVDAMGQALREVAGTALLTTLPVFVVLIVAGLAGHFLVSGWNVSSKAVTPDLMRLNPLNGIQRIFSVSGLGELVKSVLKSVVIGSVAAMVIWKQRHELLGLMTMGLVPGIFLFGRMAMESFLYIAASLAIIAGIDVPFQLWRYYDQLKMTKDELKQEYKEQEGDPQIKARIRGKQREMARRRMMQAVPKADVVVTNPTHFAVALKYDADRMGAPTVVAKGADFVAQAIRELATEHNVPLLEAPPLARALYRHAEIGEQIPAGLYTAVAEVMAYIYQLNTFIKEGGLPPATPHDLPVPAGMDPGPQAE